MDDEQITFDTEPGSSYVTQETWMRDEHMYCPACGAKTVWFDKYTPNNYKYYMDALYGCATCGVLFYLPKRWWQPDEVGAENRIKAIKAAERNRAAVTV